MKLWQFALIQLVLVGGFLYVMYSPSSYSSTDNFLQDPDNTILVTHKSSSSNQPTTSPSTTSSQNSNSTSSTQSPTNQPGASSSTGTSSSSGIAVGEPKPSGETPKTPTNPSGSTGTTNNPSPNQPETEPQSTQTPPTNPSTSNNPTTPTGAIPDPPAPGQPVDPNVPQNQPQNPNLPPEETHTTTETPSQPTEEPQQPIETETNTTWPTNTSTHATPHDGPFRGGRPVAAPGATSTSIKGSEEEPKIIFKSQQEKNGTCSQTNQRQVKLCKMSLKNNCKRYHVSEELSSWWMICPIYTANNEQTDRLYELHVNFRNYIKSFGINLQTVEVIFPGQNEFLLTEPNNQPYDLQYYSEWIFAMRENLVNVGIKHLPEDWQFMSWIDQHIFWVDPYWFEKTILAFSHYNIVHMLNGNDFWNLQNKTDYSLDGFARIWTEIGMGFVSRDPRQCGLAWGMRREIFEKLGGLLDICIGTKCDLYQNYAYVGSRYTAQTRNQEYAGMIGQWQDHAIKVYDRKLGFVDTKVVHFMHCTGSCQTSQYHLHVWALMQYDYNPNVHIRRDGEGRMSLVNNVPLALKLWELYGGPPRTK